MDFQAENSKFVLALKSTLFRLGGSFLGIRPSIYVLTKIFGFISKIDHVIAIFVRQRELFENFSKLHF